MKRHLPGVLVFALIVSVSIAVFAFVRLLTGPFDSQAVPPIIEVADTKAYPSNSDRNYTARLVQYDNQTRRLTAPLEVDRAVLNGQTAVNVELAINASYTGAQTMRLEGIATVLPGYGEKAMIVVDLIVPRNIDLRKGQNYYVAFRIGSNAGSLDPTDFGKSTPIIFIHPRPTTQRGPVILQ